ncbi:MAG TPA: flavin reductase family protein, partial [Chroococcales cyanobacterium]
EHDGKFEGMLTSWLCQAGFEPPMLTLAVKKERPVLASLGAGAKFVVNVLSKNNMDVFKNFAKPHEEGLDRFAGLRVCNDCDAGPVFTDAVAYMACKVDKQVEAGDHYVIVAEIVEGKVFTSEQEPMVHLRKSGFQY